MTQVRVRHLVEKKPRPARTDMMAQWIGSADLSPVTQKIALETNERGALAVAKTFTPSAAAFRQQCPSA
jgi:hypothetical protein